MGSVAAIKNPVNDGGRPHSEMTPCPREKALTPDYTTQLRQCMRFGPFPRISQLHNSVAIAVKAPGPSKIVKFRCRTGGTELLVRQCNKLSALMGAQ